MKNEELVSALKRIKALASECIEALERGSAARSSPKRTSPSAKVVRSAEIDFDKPLRPFIKSYAKGLSGSKKFALLLSWLAKGDPKKEIPHQQIEAEWNRMTSLLGMKFNRFFAADARDRDWVDLRKKGLYVLRPSWKDIFKG